MCSWATSDWLLWWIRSDFADDCRTTCVQCGAQRPRATHVFSTTSKCGPLVVFENASQAWREGEHLVEWRARTRWFVIGSCLHSFQLLLAKRGDSAHVQNTPAAQVAAFVHLTSVFLVSRFFKFIYLSNSLFICWLAWLVPDTLDYEVFWYWDLYGGWRM